MKSTSKEKTGTTEFGKETCRFLIGPNYSPLLGKEMATHSSTLACKIPWMEEPGRLQSMRLQRDGHRVAKMTSLTRDTEGKIRTLSS